MNYFIVFNKFTLTTLHRMLDQWKNLKMREQVSSLCCANVLSPLRCWLWSLNHRHKEHNHLNCCFSVREWKCITVGAPSLQSAMNVFIRIIKLDECTHRWCVYGHVCVSNIRNKRDPCPKTGFSLFFTSSYNLIMPLGIGWLRRK